MSDMEEEELKDAKNLLLSYYRHWSHGRDEILWSKGTKQDPGYQVPRVPDLRILVKVFETILTYLNLT